MVHFIKSAVPRARARLGAIYVRGRHTYKAQTGGSPTPHDVRWSDDAVDGNGAMVNVTGTRQTAGALGRVHRSGIVGRWCTSSKVRSRGLVCARVLSTFVADVRTKHRLVAPPVPTTSDGQMTTALLMKSTIYGLYHYNHSGIVRRWCTSSCTDNEEDTVKWLEDMVQPPSLIVEAFGLISCNGGELFFQPGGGHSSR